MASQKLMPPTLLKVRVYVAVADHKLISDTRRILPVAAFLLCEIQPAAALSEFKPHGYLIKSGGCANLVQQVATIGKMNRIRVVNEADKGWRLYTDLGHVVEFNPAPLVQGWFIVLDGAGKDSIDLACADTGRGLTIDPLDQWEDPVDSQAVEGGYRYHGGIRKVFGCLAQAQLKLAGGYGAPVHQIPLIDNHDTRTTALVRVTGHLDILFRNPLMSIQNDQSHMAALKTLQCFNN